MELQHWMLAAVGVVLVIELIKGSHRGVHRLQDIKMVALSAVGSQLLRPILTALTAVTLGFLLPQSRGALAGISPVIAFITMFIVAEFCQYWMHRFAHDSKRHPILYGMHRTHHSAPYVNVTLMYRTNLLWPFIHSYTWIAALGIHLGQVGAATVFFVTITIWNALTHSDWRWDEAIITHVPGGRRIVQAMEWVLITPRIHHAHHGYGKGGHAYGNFCTMFSVFDRLFGTLYIPEGRPWRYGLPGGEHHWARQMLYPIVPLGDPVKRDRKGQQIVSDPAA